MINCIAIDDEPLALEVLKKYISKTPGLLLTGAFSDAIEAREFVEKNHADLLFVDIQMPDINGIELYNNLTFKPMVIFTTAFKEYAVDGFEADAVDYLLKPFNFNRFQKAIYKAVQRRSTGNNITGPPDFIYIHSDYKIIKIACRDIIYIEAVDDYIKINTSGQSFLTLLSMKATVEKLPPKQFMRIHRSYIIAVDQIAYIQFRKIGLINKIELPVGDTYRADIANLKRQ